MKNPNKKSTIQRIVVIAIAMLTLTTTYGQDKPVDLTQYAEAYGVKVYTVTSEKKVEIHIHPPQQVVTAPQQAAAPGTIHYPGSQAVAQSAPVQQQVIYAAAPQPQIDPLQREADREAVRHQGAMNRIDEEGGRIVYVDSSRVDVQSKQILNQRLQIENKQMVNAGNWQTLNSALALGVGIRDAVNGKDMGYALGGYNSVLTSQQHGQHYGSYPSQPIYYPPNHGGHGGYRAGPSPTRIAGASPVRISR